jgi:hypothetical protein
MMRALGAVLLAAGAAGTAYATWASFHRRRPLDLLYAAAAPVAFALALLGMLLLFVPGFFG